MELFLVTALGLGAHASAPVHTTCRQPMVGNINVSFWAVTAFTTPGTPQFLLSMGTNATQGGQHITDVMGLSLVPSASGAGMGCAWVPSAGQLSEARTSGCATAYENTIIFAGGHNNSAAYVGTVDIFARETAFGADGRGAVGAVAPPRKGQRKLLNRRRRHPNGSGTAGVTRTKTFQLPTGRELLGCASAGNVTVFAGGKPPHPPAPFGETDEVDVWHHDTQTWSNATLSVERKKVEAVALGAEILMAGGEIGHHPPSTPTSPAQPPSSPRPGGAPSAKPSRAAADGGDGRDHGGGGRVGGYSSSVDIYNVRTKTMRTAELSLARQYFAVAVAGGKAFFGGGFANDPAGLEHAPGAGAGAGDAAEAHMPLAGFRSSVVDVYDQASNTWTVEHLSTNRSNLMGTSVANRWVVFAGGTRQVAAPDLCGGMERSAVVDIYDTQTSTWSTDCLAGGGRTAMASSSFGNTAVFFGGPGDPVDLFTFAE